MWLACGSGGRAARLVTGRLLVWSRLLLVSMCLWARLQTLIAPDELAVALHGWHCVVLWVNAGQYCKALNKCSHFSVILMSIHCSRSPRLPARLWFLLTLLLSMERHLRGSSHWYERRLLRYKTHTVCVGGGNLSSQVLKSHYKSKWIAQIFTLWNNYSDVSTLNSSLQTILFRFMVAYKMVWFASLNKMITPWKQINSYVTSSNEIARFPLQVLHIQS